MNFSWKNFFIGLIGGMAGSLIFFAAVYQSVGPYLTSNIYNTQPLVTPIIITTPVPDFWENVSLGSSLSAAAVQVFKDNKLFLQGSGAVLSSDGLIIVPAGLTVKGGIYQIFYGGKIFKGSVVKFDSNKNLALIKIDASGLNVADLDRHQYNSGQDILITAKLVDRSGAVVGVSQRGIISFSNGDEIVLDTASNTYLLGGKVINSNREFLGLFFIKSGRPQIIKAEIIKTFFKEYSSRVNYE